MNAPDRVDVVVPSYVVHALCNVGSMLESIAHLTEQLITDGADGRTNALLEALQACVEKAERELDSATTNLQNGGAA